VAVMFMSRKVLVNQVGLAAIGSSLPAYYWHPQQQIGAKSWPVMYANGQLGHLQEPRSVRANLGALLLLVAVESGWHMHHRVVKDLPWKALVWLQALRRALRTSQASACEITLSS